MRCRISGTIRLNLDDAPRRDHTVVEAAKDDFPDQEPRKSNGRDRDIGPAQPADQGPPASSRDVEMEFGAGARREVRDFRGLGEFEPRSAESIEQTPDFDVLHRQRFRR